MLYREKTAISSEIHTQHINTLCHQIVGFLTASWQHCEKRHFGFMSVHLSVRVIQLGSHWTNFHKMLFCVLFENLLTAVKFH
jgi:hypothetical protein